MFAKSSILLLASASLILASPAEVKRVPAPFFEFTNNTPNEIEYTLVAPGNTVSNGTAGSSQSRIFPIPPNSQPYSLKLAPQGQNPQTAKSILQFQLSSSTDGHLAYYWSTRNGNPDPFSKYARKIVPTQPAGACQSITCNAGQNDTSCESSSAGQGPVLVCPIRDGVIVTGTIG